MSVDRYVIFILLGIYEKLDWNSFTTVVTHSEVHFPRL